MVLGTLPDDRHRPNLIEFSKVVGGSIKNLNLHNSPCFFVSAEVKGVSSSVPFEFAFINITVDREYGTSDQWVMGGWVLGGLLFDLP